MNDKIKNIVVTLVFLFTIISLFLINVIIKDTDISIAERRKLATMPELTTKSLFDGTYFKEFDFLSEILKSLRAFQNLFFHRKKSREEAD